MKRKFERWVGDFETTVYNEQKNTEVWASGLCPMYSEDAIIFHSIEETINYLCNLSKNIIVYYHNVKFDGSFYIDFLLRNGWEQGFKKKCENEKGLTWKRKKDSELQHREFSYLISATGLWYEITLCWRKKLIKLVDSLKMLPFSLKSIGKDFQTKHQKLGMEYEGYRYAGCEITKKEEEYLKNDLYVIKEALEYMFENGHTKSTIGSNCMEEYKSEWDKEDWYANFPNLYKIPFEGDGYENYGEFINKSYRGGWCYVKENKKNKIIHGGFTLDVTSLYPSEMHSISGNRYPRGKPHYFKGDVPSHVEKDNEKYYFIHIKCRFELKEGFLPFMQIKGTLKYNPHEMLKTSDIFDKKSKKYLRYIYENGEMKEVRPELVLTMKEWQLFQRHYNLFDLEIIDGCWFWTEIGIFDNYINRHFAGKQKGKGAKRSVEKLYLNNLYGQFAKYIDSSFKMAYIGEDDVVHFHTIEEKEKKPGYIAIGSAITGYTRFFTISHAQANYSIFCYSDTDSIHCEGSIEDVKKCEIAENSLRTWKHESNWDKAIFCKQKMYIEHIEDGKDGYYDIKCAGMSDKCKKIFNLALLNTDGNVSRETLDELKETLHPLQYEFIQKGAKLTGMKEGLQIWGNLKSKRIKGGTVLKEDFFTIR